MFKWWKSKRFIALSLTTIALTATFISVAAATNYQYKIKPTVLEQLHQDQFKQEFLALKLDPSILSDKNQTKLNNMVVRLTVLDDKSKPIMQARSVYNVYDQNNNILFVRVNKDYLKLNYTININFEHTISSINFVVNEQFLANQILEDVPCGCNKKNS